MLRDNNLVLLILELGDVWDVYFANCHLNKLLVVLSKVSTT